MRRSQLAVVFLLASAAVVAVVCLTQSFGDDTILEADETILDSTADMKKMNAAVRLAKKTNTITGSGSKVQQESVKAALATQAAHLASGFVAQAIGAAARANPKEPGQAAMEHVLNDPTSLAEVQKQVEEALQTSKHIPASLRSIATSVIPGLAQDATRKAAAHLQSDLQEQKDFKSLTPKDKTTLRTALSTRARDTAAGYVGEAVERVAKENPKEPGRNAMMVVVNSMADRDHIIDQVEKDLKTSRTVRQTVPASLRGYISLIARGVARQATSDAIEQMRSALQGPKPKKA